MSALSDPVPDSGSSWRPVVAAIGLSFVFGALGYLATAHWLQAPPAPQHRAPAPTDCDLRQTACGARFPGGQTLTLEIEPKSIPPMQPLRVSVETDGFEPERLSIEITGVTMNMGRNQTELLDTGEGSFVGEAILPVCIRRRMDWQAQVTASGPEGVWQTSFFFQTFRP